MDCQADIIRLLMEDNNNACGIDGDKDIYYRTDLAAIVQTNKDAECEYLRGSCARRAN